ncbi:MAG: uroporphyrinogen-III synthase [Candidatus Omnitrophica bacterium]|nr:uroporphyrinogen-III synthase [Candidatus Omnitrophota bacterium]
MSDKLKGLHVVMFESRLAETLGELVRLQGGIPFSAPAMKEVPIENNPDAFSFAEKLFGGGIDVVIFLTGVGARALMKVLETRYKREEVLEAFRKVIIVPRGPKPIRVLKEWNVPFAVTVPEPNTWKDVLNAIDQHKESVPVEGRAVAVQEYGVSNADLLRGLGERGAKVVRVPVYHWALPDDLGPLKEAIRRIVDGKMDVVMFTTAVQVEHVFRVAGQLGLVEGLREALKKLVTASVGPDCSEAIRSHGLQVDVEPQSPKMGPLVLATAERAGEILKSKGKSPLPPLKRKGGKGVL